MYRRYELSKLPGRLVSIKYADDRRALIGRAVAYDLRASIFMHRGTVTNAAGRSIEIDHSWFALSEIEQISVTDDAP